MVDTILYNGNIYTQAQPDHASALAIISDRVLAVGDNETILALADRQTKRVDLEGATVIPGLTDAHVHFQWLTEYFHSVDVFELPSKEEVIRRVALAAQDKQPDSWITGSGWSQDFWRDSSFPTAADLDATVSSLPIILFAKSGHAAWVNTKALQIAGIDINLSDPVGGEIVRDEAGVPTGLLLENAIDLVADKIPEDSPDDLATKMRYTQEQMLASGLTGIHDFDDQSCFVALQILRERGDLGIRVVKNINRQWFDDLINLGIRWGFGDDWIRIGGLKLFADGALGPRTATMVEPYEGEPDNFGIQVLDKEEMVDYVRTASLSGMPSTIHAIGDRAVRDVLDTYEIVRQEEQQHGILPTQRRHRIEHVQLIHPEDQHRLATLDIIASMQPKHATSDWHVADRYWGKRAKLAYNPRIQLDQGVHVAFGSDAPVEKFDPLANIYAAVTRQTPDGLPEGGWYPESRLSINEAILGFTQGPAYAAGMENRLGKLASGYLADLVVLDKDVYSVPPSELVNANVLATMVGGQWRYGIYDS